MSFDQHGFLGKEIESFAVDIRKKYKDAFELICDVNDFAQSVKFNFEINRRDPQQLAAAGLFIRVANSFQSSVILCERGLITDAMVVLRSNIEGICILKLTCEDADFIREYANSQKVEQVKLMNVILNDCDEVFNQELKDEVTKERRDKLKVEIYVNKIRSLSVEELARRAGLRFFYQTAYRVLSSDEHIAPQTLNKYFALDNDGEVEFLECTPQTEGISAVIGTGISIMLIALDACSKLFSVNMEKEIEQFEKRLLSLKQ